MDEPAPHGPSAPDTLTTLAAGTVHDLNNLLVLVLGCAEMMLDDPTLSGGSRALVHEIVGTSERAASLTRQLLALARSTAVPHTAIDASVALRDVEAQLRRSAGRATLSFDVATSSLWVQARRGDIERVVTNLVSNARDAMPEGGALTIRAAAVDDETPNGGLRRPLVRITVADTGHGIEPAIRERIFDAFASSKSEDRHCGLGLAVVRAVVERLGGSIGVTSTLGEGTTFVIDLPMAQPARADHSS